MNIQLEIDIINFLNQIRFETDVLGKATWKERCQDCEGQLAILRDKAKVLLLRLDNNV